MQVWVISHEIMTRNPYWDQETTCCCSYSRFSNGYCGVLLWSLSLWWMVLAQRPVFLKKQQKKKPSPRTHTACLCTGFSVLFFGNTVSPEPNGSVWEVWRTGSWSELECWWIRCFHWGRFWLDLVISGLCETARFCSCSLKWNPVCIFKKRFHVSYSVRQCFVHELEAEGDVAGIPYSWMME